MLRLRTESGKILFTANDDTLALYKTISLYPEKIVHVQYCMGDAALFATAFNTFKKYFNVVDDVVQCEDNETISHEMTIENKGTAFKMYAFKTPIGIMACTLQQVCDNPEVRHWMPKVHLDMSDISEALKEAELFMSYAFLSI